MLGSYIGKPYKWNCFNLYIFVVPYYVITYHKQEIWEIGMSHWLRLIPGFSRVEVCVIHYIAYTSIC